MSADRFAQYRGKEEDTFKSETPITLLNEYIPQPVIIYYTSHKFNTLGDVYFNLRDAWESLKTTGKDRNIGELTLEDIALEEPEFNELMVKVTRLLEADYLKNELIRRYNPPKRKLQKIDKTPWFMK